MDWNSIKNQWQDEQPKGEIPDFPRDDDTTRLWATVRHRDWLETIVGLAMLPLFAYFAFRSAMSEQWLTAFFAALLCVVDVYIPLRLLRARKLIPAPDPQQTVQSFLRMEKRALQAQADMLRSVSRWYSGPICIGAVGFFGSIRGLGMALLGYSLVVLALFILIEWLNRSAATKKFAPAIAAVEEQLTALEE